MQVLCSTTFKSERAASTAAAAAVQSGSVICPAWTNEGRSLAMQRLCKPINMVSISMSHADCRLLCQQQHSSTTTAAVSTTGHLDFLKAVCCLLCRWNFTPSPGWTKEESLILKLCLMKFGIGQWVQIQATGLLPGKLIQQLNGATQRLVGQQSLAGALFIVRSSSAATCAHQTARQHMAQQQQASQQQAKPCSALHVPRVHNADARQNAWLLLDSFACLAVCLVLSCSIFWPAC
jgi:hypothetical protein